MFVVLRLNIEGLINEEIWTLLLKLADLHPDKILVFRICGQTMEIKVEESYASFNSWRGTYP